MATTRDRSTAEALVPLLLAGPAVSPVWTLRWRVHVVACQWVAPLAMSLVLIAVLLAAPLRILGAAILLGAGDAAPPAAIQIRVRGVIGVPLGTVRDLAPPRPVSSAPHVLVVRDGLQVRRIHTDSVAAQMVKRLAIWNGAAQLGVGQAMGFDDATVPPKRAVATRGCPCPLPTLVDAATSDFRPEMRGQVAGRDWQGFRWHNYKINRVAIDANHAR